MTQHDPTDVGNRGAEKGTQSELRVATLERSVLPNTEDAAYEGPSKDRRQRMCKAPTMKRLSRRC